MQRRFPNILTLTLFWALIAGATSQGAGAETPAPVAPPMILTAQPNLIEAMASSNLTTKGVFARSKGYEQTFAAGEEYLQGHYDAAIAAAEQVIAQTPGIYGAWEVLGCSYWKSGRTNEARRVWQRLLIIDPNVARAHNLLGAVALAQRQFDEAEKEFRASLALKPDDNSTRFALALVLRSLHRTAEAAEIFRKYLADDAERHDARLQLVLCMVEEGQYDEALTLWHGLPPAARTNNAGLMLIEADILMNTGSTTGAIQNVLAVLAAEPDNESALRMLACACEYGKQPEEAIPYLKRIIKNTKEKYTRQHTRMRLMALCQRLNKADPLRFSLDEALAVTQDFLEEAPDNPDARMALGDLLGGNLRLDQAEQQYLKVVREYNPHNRRAHDGLFQVYLAQHDYGKAREHLQTIASFNPQNPYLHYLRAQLAESQGDLFEAQREIAQLEAAGAQGAVAVIIYHGIVNSELSEVMPARILREHLQILKKAGFRFITAADLPKYLADRKLGGGHTPELVAVVTFDDARRDSFSYGTPVLREQQVIASMHVPVTNIERGDGALSSWDLLKQYQTTGIWVMGSHLMNASDIMQVDAQGTMAYPLANHLWLEKEKRLENDSEYRERIKNEYRLSREIMEQRLGARPSFIAYPMGDIGQETRSDVPDAIAVNLANSATNYSVGFIQSVFGYAVSGDNPLLYQRFEPDRSISAAELLHQVMEYHPVFMAQRLQAKYAAQGGKRHKALNMVEKLKQSGYPTNLCDKVEKTVRDDLYGRSRAPGNIDKVRKGPYQLDLSKPYLAARADYFSDNYESKIFHLLGAAGLNLTPNISAEGFGGIGQLKQGAAAGAVPPNAVSIDEQVVGLAPTITFPFPMQLSGQIAQRSFTGDADTSLPHYSAALAAKPLLPLDLNAQFEHDAPPSARSVIKKTTYNMGTLAANWNLFDWWDLPGSYQHFAYSDGNHCDHLRLGSKWLVWSEPGLYAGLNYQYSSAPTKSLDYWTPYHLNRYFAEAQLRGSYRRVYYNLQARLGIGKEDPRPLETQTQTKWEPVLGLSASSRVKMGEHWEINGEVGYDKMPNYNQMTLLAGLKYTF